MKRFERDSRSPRTGRTVAMTREKEGQRKREGGTSELRESRATGSGIFVAPLFECSGGDDRGYIVAKRSSLRELSVLSFTANHIVVVTAMTRNTKISMALIV